MKIEMWKNVLTSVAICSMSAGLASAATVWNPAASGIIPPAVGDWADANWTSGVPLADTKTVFNVGNAAECVVTTSDAVAGQLVMGDNGPSDALHVLRIASGGTLTSGIAGDGWSAVSYNRPAHCIVEAGGTFNTLARMGVGLVSGGDGLLEVYGDVSIDGNFQVASGPGRTGTVMLYGGGTISATGLEMGDDGLIDIWQDGELFFAGVDTNIVAGFIADGKILGNRLTNNLEVVFDWTTTPGVTNATVTAIDSIPNLAGLTTNEAAEVLTQFGYTVGTITEDTAPGGITGLVIYTDPAAGTAPLNPGDAINLVIQQAGQVPDVVGLDNVTASNVIVAAQYVPATGIVTYEFDQTPGLVTSQDPAGFSPADQGTTVTIDYNEPLAAESTITAGIGGDWMGSIWTPLDVPFRDVQNYEVRIAAGTLSPVTVTNFVAMRRLQVGNGAIGELDVLDGGHVLGAMYGDYVALGWNQDAVVNIYAGGILESREALRIGWDGSSAIVNVDGGSLIAAGWMSLGKSNKTDESGQVYQSYITISNGGSVLCDRFRLELDGITYQEGTITLAEGTLATTGDDASWIEDGLASGFIVVAEGYVASTAVIDNNYTLTSRLPTYEGWSKLWGEDIGSETDDFDDDGADNLLEYGLNGDPTNALVTGSNPVLDGSTMTYTHLQRADDSNLVYTVVTTDMLTAGTWGTSGVTEMGTDVTGDDYNVVTNSIATDIDVRFIRLEIDNL